MKWEKVALKFFKGLLAGGVAAGVGALNTPNADIETAKAGGLVSLVMGFLSGLFNWYKHRKDL